MTRFEHADGLRSQSKSTEELGKEVREKVKIYKKIEQTLGTPKEQREKIIKKIDEVLN